MDERRPEATANGLPYSPVFSRDARLVSFRTRATDFDEQDTNEREDLYLLRAR